MFDFICTYLIFMLVFSPAVVWFTWYTLMYWGITRQWMYVGLRWGKLVRTNIYNQRSSVTGVLYTIATLILYAPFIILCPFFSIPIFMGLRYVKKHHKVDNTVDRRSHYGRHVPN